MKVFQKFKNGLDIGSNSFQLLWKNKKLIIYLGIPVFIKSIIDLITYNLYIDPTALKIPLFQKKPVLMLIKMTESYSWGKYILLQSISFLCLILLLLGSILLTCHVSKIIQNSIISIKETVKACRTKIPRAILWAIIVFIPLLLQNYSNNKAHYLVILAFSIWSILTAFVIQALSLDNTTIIQALKKSVLTVRSLFTQYIGAIFWIGLVTVLSITPFLILDKYIYLKYNSQILSILSYSVATLVSCIIPTAYTIAKTLLYTRYKKEQS